MTITDIAGCCKALSDENRLSIIKMLSKGEYLMHEDLPIRTKGSGCF